jgi:hypothetical protein
MPALKVNIIIVDPRENNFPRVNNYDVHLKPEGKQHLKGEKL